MFGVLLYLGVCSLSGIQLVDRFIMMFMPPKYHPDVQYVRKVCSGKLNKTIDLPLFCVTWKECTPNCIWNLGCLGQSINKRMNGSCDAYLASPADFAGADDIITNLAKEREPGDMEHTP